MKKKIELVWDRKIKKFWISATGITEEERERIFDNTHCPVTGTGRGYFFNTMSIKDMLEIFKEYKVTIKINNWSKES